MTFQSTSTIGPIVRIGESNFAFFTHGHAIVQDPQTRKVYIGSTQIGDIICWDSSGEEKMKVPDWGFCLLRSGVELRVDRYPKPDGNNVRALCDKGWIQGTLVASRPDEGIAVSSSVPVVPGHSGMAVVGAGGVIGLEYASHVLEQKFWVQPWEHAVAACQEALRNIANGSGPRKGVAQKLSTEPWDVLSPVAERESHGVSAELADLGEDDRRKRSKPEHAPDFEKRVEQLKAASAAKSVSKVDRSKLSFNPDDDS